MCTFYYLVNIFGTIGIILLLLVVNNAISACSLVTCRALSVCVLCDMCSLSQLYLIHFFCKCTTSKELNYYVFMYSHILLDLIKKIILEHCIRITVNSVMGVKLHLYRQAIM